MKARERMTMGFKTELPEILGAAVVAMNHLPASKAGVVIFGLQAQSYREGLEEFVRHTRDREIQTLAREYFSMLAVALALAGKRAEGEGYLAKAWSLPPSGGHFERLCRNVHYIGK